MENIAFVKNSKEKHDVSFVEEVLPELSENECLIEVHAVGICGSDLHMYEGHGGYEWITYPLVLGHEVTGKIIDVGNLKNKGCISKRIVIDPYTGCGKCSFCKNGETNRCDSGTFQLNKTPTDALQYGFRKAGGLAKFMIADINNCIIIDEAITDEVAAISEALAVSYTAILKVNDYTNKKILVVGPGPIGLGALAILVGGGNKQVDVLGTREDGDRLNLAKKIGAQRVYVDSKEIIEESFSGYDVVIDSSGHPSVPRESIKLLKRGGQMVLVGINHADFSLQMSQVVRGEITIDGSYGITRKNYEKLLELASEPEYPFDRLIAEKVNFKDVIKGLELASKKVSGKVVVRMKG
ncbi:zinc-dependent alcohol dehydrogenase [Oceanobacillus damuensis]|uniref:zinc-dependent alcohol dehydrogenase n=1 Tax=Oceanobacillus damuensis TaxID=937928 RepID=UPI000831E82C|nr:alcohol dehydrogenase catalytic domain-containing protein [Oceanobacillus damuensis]